MADGGWSATPTCWLRSQVRICPIRKPASSGWQVTIGSHAGTRRTIRLSVSDPLPVLLFETLSPRDPARMAGLRLPPFRNVPVALQSMRREVLFPKTFRKLVRRISRRIEWKRSDYPVKARRRSETDKTPMIVPSAVTGR